MCCCIVDIVPTPIKVDPRNDENWTVKKSEDYEMTEPVSSPPNPDFHLGEFDNLNDEKEAVAAPTQTIDSTQNSNNNKTFDSPQFILHETIRTGKVINLLKYFTDYIFAVGTRIHGGRNEALQPLKAHHSMELDKKGIFAEGLELLKKIFNFMREDSHLQDDLENTVRQKSLKETQMQLQLNAKHTSMLISQYETLAFPSDLCSTHQEPKILPAFDDLKCKIENSQDFARLRDFFLVFSDLEDAVAQRQSLLKEDRNLKNCNHFLCDLPFFTDQYSQP